MKNRFFRPQTQRGVALATALVFLVILTLLGVFAMRASTTELRLARNEQARIEALETAQAVVDAVAADSANLPINSDEDYLRCFESANTGTQTACPIEQAGLSLGPITDGSATATQREIFDNGVYAEARRLPPADIALPGQTLMSMDKLSAVGFGVRGQYARGEEGLGAADIEQGILSLAPRNARIEY